MIIFWFFFDFNAAIILFGLWWKVEFGDGFVVFENDLLVGSGCFFFGVEGAKITLFTCTVIQKIKKREDFFYYLFHRLFYFVHFIMCWLF